MPIEPSNQPSPVFGVPERLADLIVRYYDAELSEQQLAELREGLMENAAARDLFVQWGLQIQTLTESLAPQYSEAEESIPFAALAEMEANAQAELVELHDLGGSRFNMKRYAIAGTIAAVLVMAITLTFVFSGTGNTPEIANETSEPGRIGPDFAPAPTNNVVATLTAERDAVWKQPGGDARPGALRQGTPLSAGQRLTLTQGFAEITTARGAIAILEAPATIELLDNANALHIHAGKLVGICETESSKGLLVQTPAGDVIDIGTVFGVEVIDDNRTEVQVITGQVELAPRNPADGLERFVRLSAGDAARLDKTVAQVTAIKAQDKRFVTSLVHTLDLVDIIAGGDGTEQRERIGLDPLSGSYRPGLREIDPYLRQGKGQFFPVPDAPYVAGAFIPRGDGAVSDVPDGINLPPMPGNHGASYGLIWCGGPIPAEEGRTISAVMDGVDYSADGNRALGLHANSAVVIDLDAIRVANPGKRIARFESAVNNTATTEILFERPRSSRVAVGLDQRVAFEHVFVASKAKPAEATTIEIDPGEARYLVLMATDGGDGVDLDWIVLGNPRLILEPKED